MTREELGGELTELQERLDAATKTWQKAPWIQRLAFPRYTLAFLHCRWKVQRGIKRLENLGG
jgi:hypothetical protein